MAGSLTYLIEYISYFYFEISPKTVLSTNNLFLLLESSVSSSICRDFIRNVCKRGSKCRFSHIPSVEVDEGPQDKRLRPNNEPVTSYNKNDGSVMAGNRQDSKESMGKDKTLAPMQMKVTKQSEYIL